MPKQTAYSAIYFERYAHAQISPDAAVRAIKENDDHNEFSNTINARFITEFEQAISAVITDHGTPSTPQIKRRIASGIVNGLSMFPITYESYHLSLKDTAILADTDEQTIQRTAKPVLGGRLPVNDQFILSLYATNPDLFLVSLAYNDALDLEAIVADVMGRINTIHFLDQCN